MDNTALPAEIPNQIQIPDAAIIGNAHITAAPADEYADLPELIDDEDN